VLALAMDAHQQIRDEIPVLVASHLFRRLLFVQEDQDTGCVLLAEDNFLDLDLAVP